MVNEMSGYPEKILEPTSGEGNLVQAIKNRYPASNVIAPSDYYQLPWDEYDYIVSNPPFTPMTTGYRLLDGFFNRSSNIIILLPWLALINSEKRYQKYLSEGLKKVIHLPRRAFPRSRVQCCVLVFERGYRGDVKLEFAYTP
ncbi:hypothetical protein RE474_09640 [Methanolobus sediminis]|uniref:Uncharacterized protein n=1 Tax=Methanolobus sediminis TaxID=3072978 RepID=A0AA51UIV2_9EURY|nr:hypothetical protein [Methanolobus sediminis]WMW24351.1 hypothetical protein RE474_09640 [Methanolobus sediminis]